MLHEDVARNVADGPKALGNATCSAKENRKSLKELALLCLAESKKQCATHSATSNATCCATSDATCCATSGNKANSDLSSFLPTMEDLEADFKSDSLWPKLKVSPSRLEHLQVTVAINRMIDKGLVPPTFTTYAYCERCGLVPLDMEGSFAGCPWCFGYPGEAINQQKRKVA